jgi:DMSO/TMAO reductase YedYZ molybdopterin-dependent catalytic subunit
VAYAMNGAPPPPRHGHPLRLIVPGWYGMAHVKWLRGITVTDTPFTGFQQTVAYTGCARTRATRASRSPVSCSVPGWCGRAR